MNFSSVCFTTLIYTENGTKKGLAIYINKKSFNALLPGTIPISQAIKGQNKTTKTCPNIQENGPKSPKTAN